MDQSDDIALQEIHPTERTVRDLVVTRFHLASLYPYQELVIQTILECGGLFGHERQLSAWKTQIVVLPTGSGKSVCFMLPALLLPGITVAVYPLLSLMNDQCRRMEALGFPAVQLKGGTSNQERNQIFARLARGEVRFLITNPEMLEVEMVLSILSSMNISLMVIDEVHTVTQWGDTFRPSYQHLKTAIDRLAPDQVTAFTATASPRILKRISEMLFSSQPVHVVKGNPDRPNISYRVLLSISKFHDVEMLCRHSLERPLVIFCSTRHHCEQLAWILTERLEDHAIRYYHAGLDQQERTATERWFFNHREAILCATCAYGMGVDKADIRSIIHFDIPSDAESYLQESGRAGRDGKPAQALVLLGENEYSRLQSSRSTPGFKQLCGVFIQDTVCRRESLMQLMGVDNDTCSGCDVCQQRISGPPPEAKIILSLLCTHPGTHAKETVAHTLAGSRSRVRCPDRLRVSSWFGRLPDWRSEDISHAIDSLKTMGMIKECAHWPWKGKLFATHRSWNVNFFTTEP